MPLALSRRQLLAASLASAGAGLLGCRKTIDLGPVRSGLPAPRPGTAAGAGHLSLPPGFSCTVLQTAGDLMSDGIPMPMQPDGMTCHVDGDGNYVLLRNHELGNADWVRSGGLDPAALRAGRTDLGELAMLGGVSKLTVHPRHLMRRLRGADPTECVVDSRLILNGTDRNCSGGRTPHGWISCEESSNDGHGWAYQTFVSDTTLVDRDARRLPSWGRFQREGVALDASTGIAYQTEDHRLGALYRHVPSNPDHPTGPGRLQALSIAGVVHTDRHSRAARGLEPDTTPLEVGVPYGITWVDVADPAATTHPCREQARKAGASLFTRGEGITQDASGRVWFSATSGGPASSGQLWRLDPSNHTLTLVYEVTDPRLLSLPDNIVITPWGDLLMAEDNYHPTDSVRQQHIRALTPDGVLYDIARNENVDPASTDSAGAEFAGPCFSPDGRVLFINLQHPDSVTLAITGPWPTARMFS